MRQIGKSKIVTARKNYGCDASEWIHNWDVREYIEGLTFAEKRIVAKAHMNGWRVMKGDPCLTYTLVSCDGKDIIRIRSIPEINELNHKQGVYDDAEYC